MSNTVRGRSVGIRTSTLLIFLAAARLASAETLVLNDGTVIQGDVRSLQNDVYTVQSDTLGTVRVRKQDVQSIAYADQASPAAPTQAPGRATLPSQTDLEAIQSQMLQIPDLFSMIEALQGDPQVQAVLSDPEIMSAVAAGDFATLMNHPKIISLTKNANMREVIEQVQ